jgi:hypothetical protein
MLRPLLQSSLRSKVRTTSRLGKQTTFAFGTQSGDDAKKPTALARLHLEDGTTMTGRSFGCHESVEGEVRTNDGSVAERLAAGVASHIVDLVHVLLSHRLCSLREWSDIPKA